MTKLRILILDDDAFLLSMYSKKFETEGSFDVVAVNNPAQALERFRNKESFDIVLSDIALPGQSGLELLKVVKDEKLIPTATYIMLSNQSNDGEQDTAKALGADGFIIKATTVPSKVLSEVLSIHQHKQQSTPKA